MDDEAPKRALESAIASFECGEPVGDDVLVYSSTALLATTQLAEDERVEVARLQLSSPAVSWRVTAEVDDTRTLRVLLSEVSAEDPACLRVRGDIRVRTRGMLGPGSPCVTRRERFPRPRRAPMVTVMDGSGTVASVDAKTVSELKVTVTTFYYSPAKADADEDQSIMQLCVDLEDLRATRDLADVVLVVEGRYEMPAHKAVLGARSGVFRSLFLNDPTVTHVNLPDDMSYEEMNTLLRYMYSGLLMDCESPFGDDVQELLINANRFKIQGLEDGCREKLVKSLSKDNALEVWAFAREHGFEDLKMRAQIVAVENLKEVTASKEWRSYSRRYPSLAVDLLECTVQMVDFK